LEEDETYKVNQPFFFRVSES